VEAEVRIPKVGKTVSHWALEALMILVSVGLAFGVAEYRESRANHELAGRVMRSVEAEVEHNLATLEPWQPYNAAFRQQLAKADTSDSSKTAIDIYIGVRPPLPAGAVVDTPIMRRGAWDAALSTGALRLIDYDVVAALSEIYQMQDMHNGNVGRQVAAGHAAISFDPANRVAVFRQLVAGQRELAYSETLLINVYRQHLPAIRAAAAH
jgi:hypothetical protein